MNALVAELIKSGVLKSPSIINAFLEANRSDFVPSKYLNLAFEDIPLPIGSDQTISQPTTVAFMLELLDSKEGQKILDVGSGSGWTTAILAYIVGEKGLVIGTEIIPELVKLGIHNLKKYSLPQAKILQAGNELGHREEAPYDRILVSAAAANLPEELISQLRNGGKMVLPVENSIWHIEKDKNGKITKREFPGFIFVPLIH